LLVETKESVLTPALGVVGSAGVFFLIVVALAGPSPLTRRLPTVGDLGKLAAATLLVCLAGGAGEVVALFVTPNIRCYGRLSIYLSFFAYLGIGLMLADHLRRRRAGRAGRGFLAFLAAGTALALLDQIPSGVVPDYPRDAAAFRSDRRFVERVQSSVPEGSAIFQLPPNSFPEFGMHVNMYDYNHFRGYFHSDRLRWSYGAIRGRADEKLHSSLAPLPPGPLVDRLVDLGFAGIYFNRRGHAEAGRDVIRRLLEKVPQTPIASDDGELLFFKLPPASSASKPGP